MQRVCDGEQRLARSDCRRDQRARQVRLYPSPGSPVLSSAADPERRLPELVVPQLVSVHSCVSPLRTLFPITVPNALWKA